MSNVRTQIGKVIGKSLNGYHSRVKPKIDELKFKEQYQGRIIDCMVGEVDDNYIETPLTDENIVKLEHSKEGVIKIPQIKGKTILVDADGNETDTPAEGCRLVSVGEEEDNKLIILSKNKNLITSFIKGSVSSGNGNFYEKSDAIVTDYIEIKRENIKISNIYNEVSSFVAYYDENKNYIRRTRGVKHNDMTLIKTDNPSTGNTYDIPLECKFIRLTIYIASNQTSTYEQIVANSKRVQIEYGIKTTSFVEPKQHKTEILLSEPLRSLPNGVCDEIVDNKLIRRIGYFILDEKVFNIGSESAGWKPQIQTIPFYKYCNQFKPELKVKTNSLCFSNRLSINKSFVASDIEGLGFSSGNPYASYFGGRLKRDKIENQDGYSVANYINNTQILYELAEPIIEELPNAITLQGFDDTTIYIENSITPTVTYGYNALIPYKEELSTQKEEVETNTLDIENNIIPYLMDMEYNLMLMEDN